jgi:hypothetical protein
MDNAYMIERLGKQRYAERLAESERLHSWLPEVKKLQARHRLRRAIHQIVERDGDAHRLLNEIPTLVQEAQERLHPKPACRSCGASR